VYEEDRTPLFYFLRDENIKLKMKRAVIIAKGEVQSGDNRKSG